MASPSSRTRTAPPAFAQSMNACVRSSIMSSPLGHHTQAPAAAPSSSTSSTAGVGERRPGLGRAGFLAIPAGGARLRRSDALVRLFLERLGGSTAARWRHVRSAMRRQHGARARVHARLLPWRCVHEDTALQLSCEVLASSGTTMAGRQRPCAGPPSAACRAWLCCIRMGSCWLKSCRFCGCGVALPDANGHETSTHKLHPAPHRQRCRTLRCAAAATARRGGAL